MSETDERPAFIGPQVSWVECWVCGQVIEELSRVEGIDVSDPDEYYPRMRPVCPSHVQKDDKQIDRGEHTETDGGRETLGFADGRLSIPEEIDASEGLVIRPRGVTVDHKPGSVDCDEYPLQECHLDADERVQNDHLDDFEVSLKPYGEEAQRYDVRVAVADGGSFEKLSALERQAEALEEIAEQQRIQNAVLFELARTLDHRLPELRKHPPEEPSNPRSGRSLASWVEDAALDLDERVDLNAVDRVSEGSQ